MSTPKPKTAEAYEFLSNYNGLSNPDNMRFRRWLQDADQLIKIEPDLGYMLKSFAYVLMGKSSEALYAMNNAKGLGAVGASKNLMNIHHAMGNFEESTKIALDNIAYNPQSVEYMQTILRDSLRVLDKDIIEKGLNLYKGDHQDLLLNQSSSVLNQIDLQIELLEQLNIPKEVFVKIARKIHLFLSKNYVGNSVLTIEDEYTEIGANLRLNVFLKNVDESECIELNNSFLESLISDESFSFDDYKDILVNFIPVEYAEVL